MDWKLSHLSPLSISRYEPEDQLEWSLVLEEIKGFIKAESAVAVLHADTNPIILSHRWDWVGEQMKAFCPSSPTTFLFVWEELSVCYPLSVGPSGDFSLCLKLFQSKIDTPKRRLLPLFVPCNQYVSRICVELRPVLSKGLSPSVAVMKRPELQ